MATCKPIMFSVCSHGPPGECPTSDASVLICGTECPNSNFKGHRLCSLVIDVFVIVGDWNFRNDQLIQFENAFSHCDLSFRSTARALGATAASWPRCSSYAWLPGRSCIAAAGASRVRARQSGRNLTACE